MNLDDHINEQFIPAGMGRHKDVSKPPTSCTPQTLVVLISGSIRPPPLSGAISHSLVPRPPMQYAAWSIEHVMRVWAPESFDTDASRRVPRGSAQFHPTSNGRHWERRVLYENDGWHLATSCLTRVAGQPDHATLESETLHLWG
jgi:hypothetical protein